MNLPRTDPASNLVGVTHSSAEPGTDLWISELIPVVIPALPFTCSG